MTSFVRVIERMLENGSMKVLVSFHDAICIYHHAQAYRGGIACEIAESFNLELRVRYAAMVCDQSKHVQRMRELIDALVGHPDEPAD